MIRATAVHAAAPPVMAAAACRSLLGYPIRRAAALELLYGGVRIQHLIQKPFPLRRIQSEKLPSPSLERERSDLELEMYAPHDLQGYNGVHMNMQRHISSQTALDAADDDDSRQQQRHGVGRSGFDLSSFFATAHHPDRHHTSSLPYSGCDSNNVLGLRLYPVNMSVRARTESVRVRAEDCLRRLRSERECAAVGIPLCYPLPASTMAEYNTGHPYSSGSRGGGDNNRTATLFTPSEHDPHKPASVAEVRVHKDARLAHLRGGPCHPPPSQLSIVTRWVDYCHDSSRATSKRTSVMEGNSHPIHEVAAVRYGAGTMATRRYPGKPVRYWMPLQMVKPMGHAWSPAVRSSGVRGPSMQLYQERLDQKGFGWKRKSRSLWQQDIATAGFRPHRYF